MTVILGPARSRRQMEADGLIEIVANWGDVPPVTAGPQSAPCGAHAAILAGAAGT